MQYCRHARLWRDIPDDVTVSSYRTRIVEGYADGGETEVSEDDNGFVNKKKAEQDQTRTTTS